MKRLHSLKPHPQSKGEWCGPASLKTILDHLGRSREEQELVRLCGTSDHGTEHAGLIVTAQTLGAHIFEKTDGALEEIAWFLVTPKLPVLVAWWSDYHPPAGPHYSVICRMSRNYVFLADPEEKRVRRMRHHSFLTRWHDCDTSIARTYERWYMVIAFRGKIKSPFVGTHHLPLQTSV
ncbi:MAG: cysteine peptidase family C39 domain-containing protein [bacterium]|nr:cysteine peptidase family C39 domain-containing protein [bacterium]